MELSNVVVFGTIISLGIICNGMIGIDSEIDSNTKLKAHNVRKYLVEIFMAMILFIIIIAH